MCVACRTLLALTILGSVNTWAASSPKANYNPLLGQTRPRERLESMVQVVPRRAETRMAQFLGRRTCNRKAALQG